MSPLGPGGVPGHNGMIIGSAARLVVVIARNANRAKGRLENGMSRMESLLVTLVEETIRFVFHYWRMGGFLIGFVLSLGKCGF